MRASSGDPAAIRLPTSMADFFSRNEEMRRCLELARFACDLSAPVLITGERGSGKNLLASAIHRSSPRKSLPCVVLKCAAIGGKSAKTRLFGGVGEVDGHGGGAKGLFEQAGGGTLIIDEADLLPGFVQQQLLGFLRQNCRTEARRSNSVLNFGTRLVTTSGGDQDNNSITSLLIEDLLYYLGEITIRIPPLRRRREDIPALTDAALAAANATHGKNVGGLSQAAANFIQRYDFPGNVQELFLIIDRAVSGSSRDTLDVKDFELSMDSMGDDPHPLSDTALMPLAEVEKQHIHWALRRTGWKKQAAASLLHVSLIFLERKISLYRLGKIGGDD